MYLNHTHTKAQFDKLLPFQIGIILPEFQLNLDTAKSRNND